MNSMINERDLISMKLLHYFITKKNYNPIIVQGVENEIWLENLDEEYKVVRIVNSYIHNDEQLDFDIFKTKRMVKKIKRKTFSFNMKTLSILTDVGDNVNIDRNISDVLLVHAKNEESINNNVLLNSIYNDLSSNMQFTEEGFQLFLKITTEINEKNKRESMENDKIFEQKPIVVNNILIGLLIFVFVMSVVLGYDEFFIYRFGVFKAGILSGEWYRLLTGTFIHAGLVHLICNCYALYVVGNQIENFYGKARFILIYLFSALTGSLLSIAMHNTISVGASGAIFGLFGSLLYFGYYYRIYFGSVILRQVVPVIIINLFIGFSLNGIDNFAHIGGLIGGVLISSAVGIKNNYKKNRSERINGVILSSIFLIFLIYLGIFLK